MDYSVGRLGGLLWSATASTLTSVSMAIFGIILTKMGILTPTVAKGVSAMVKDVAVPCLLFSRVGRAISIANLLKWLPVPVLAILNTLYGCAIGYGIAKLACLPNEIARFAMVSIGFTNTNTIPLAFMETISSSEYNLLSLPGTHETPKDVNERGVTFILMYSLAITFLRWTLADKMLEHKPGDGGKQIADASPIPLLNPTATQVNETIDTEKETEKDNEEPPLTTLQTIKKYLLIILNLFPIPLWACILAVVVGLIPPLRNLFFPVNNPDTPIPPPPPLAFLTTAITNIGATVTPLMNIVLGNKLLKGPNVGAKKKARFSKSISTGSLSITRNDQGGIDVKFVVLIAWLKLVIVPLSFGIGIIYLLGVKLTSWITDPTMMFVLLLESANPPALLLLLMCTSNDFMVEEMTTLIFYSYMFALVTLTLFCFMILLLIAA